MAKVPTAAVAASGLIGGYGVARWTKKRPLGGAVLAVAGAAAAQQWQKAAGAKAAGALTMRLCGRVRRVASAGEEGGRLACGVRGGRGGRAGLLGGG